MKLISCEIQKFHHKFAILKFFFINLGTNGHIHCVKSVLMRSYFWSVLSLFGLNSENYFVNLHIQSEYRKIQTRNNSVFAHFSRSNWKQRNNAQGKLETKGQTEINRGNGFYRKNIANSISVKQKINNLIHLEIF